MGVTKYNVLQADQFLGSQTEASPFGKIWYVDSTNGSDGNSGLTPSEAFASVAAVDAVMVEARGDTAIFAPGTYTISTAVVPESYTTWKAAIVHGSNPSVKFSGNIANLFDIEESGVRFIGIEFLATGTTVTDLVKISDTANVDGPIFEDCKFNGASKASGSNYLSGNCGIATTDGTYYPTGLVIRRCLFTGLGKTNIDIGVLGIPYGIIENNVISVNTNSGTGIYMADAGATTVGKGFVIQENDFLGFDATRNEVGITLVGTEDATSMGMIRNNYFAYFAAAAITANKNTFTMVNNYYGDSATGGVLVVAGS